MCAAARRRADHVEADFAADPRVDGRDGATTAMEVARSDIQWRLRVEIAVCSARDMGSIEAIYVHGSRASGYSHTIWWLQYDERADTSSL